MNPQALKDLKVYKKSLSRLKFESFGKIDGDVSVSSLESKKQWMHAWNPKVAREQKNHPDIEAQKKYQGSTGAEESSRH